MRFSKNGEELVLYFEGRIDSGNAAKIEAEAMSILTAEAHSAVAVDAAKLEYISSAGLRVILKIAKGNKNTRIINVSAEVYEVLEITGFSEMLPVERALRELSLEGCPVIGQGSVGTIYRYDADTVVKCYREGTSLEDLKAEQERSRLALVKGVPTSITFDIVRVGDLYATVYELVNSCSMGHRVHDDPACYPEMAVHFGKVLREIHAIEAAELPIPTVEAVYRRAHKNLTPFYSDEENAIVASWLDAMPRDTKFIHGDFHTKNIMMQGDEPLLIDMGDISIGHPLSDIATAWFVLLWIEPDLSEKSSGIPRAVAGDFFDIFLRTYFETEDETALAELKTVINAMADLRAAIIYGIDFTRPVEAVRRRTNEVRQKAFPHAAETLENIRRAKEVYDRYFPG